MSRINRKFLRRERMRRTETTAQDPFVPFHLRMAGPPIDWRKIPSLIRDDVVSRVWSSKP